MARQEKYIVVTIRVHQDDGQYAAYCDELGTASCGDTIEEALQNINDAIALHLNTFEEIGERTRFLKERGIRIQSRPAGHRVHMNPGELTMIEGIPVPVYQKRPRMRVSN